MRNIYIIEVKDSGVWGALKACITREEADIFFCNLRNNGKGCRIVDNDTGEVLESFEPENVKKEEVVYCDDCGKRIKKGTKVYWYDYVMLDLKYNQKIIRKVFCTVGCAKHHFQRAALVVADPLNDVSDVDWLVEEVENENIHT